MPDKVSNKDRLKEITASIEDGIKELFQSDKYAQYLRTMSRFHRYSVNNITLIHLQRPNATFVAGFNKWKDQFSRNVIKGEKSIKIIAPTPFKKKIEQEKRDPDTHLPMLDADGKIITEEKTVQIPMYKVVSVFDVAQTEGKPLPELAANLTGDVQNYEIFMEALRRSSPVPIGFKPIEHSMDGFFSRDNQSITLREGMSEVQTVCAAVHEIAHAKLHNYEVARQAAAAGGENAEPVKEKDGPTEEVEAESISYAVCQYYGIETGENSFGYISAWSSGKELPELRASLETINKTASGLITDMDRNYAEIMKERGLDKAEPEQAAPAAKQPGYEQWSEPATPENAPTEPRLPSDDVSTYLPDESARGYPMPDPTLTVEDMHSYGYTDGDMLPVSKERAQELMAQDITIYGLKQGDRFVRVSDPWEVNNYDGMLGINTENWGEMWETLPPSALLSENEGHEKSIPADFPAEPQPERGVEEEPPITAPENGYLPDPAMSVEAMNAYGYTDADMMPLSRERAIELFQRDVPVYMLYGDNTEAMAFDTDEIIAFDGMLGVTAADWELAPAGLKEQKPDMEQAFIDNPADSFAIYQVKNGEEYRGLRFERYEQLEKQGITPDRANYDCVYTAPLTAPGGTTDRLDALYDAFNNNLPADYHARSASVSDIIALKQAGEVSYHYIDAWEYKELPAFQKPENYLKNAEMAMEDDYGMIDGVINNGVKQPTVAELEQQAKSGTPISLMDLAAASHRERDGERKEKRSSVLAQLKSHQEKEKSNTALKKSAEREL